MLTNVEKMKLERAFGMASGYVLAFVNRTFEGFFKDVVGVEIYSDRYNQGTGSKANRLRAFWDSASDDEILKFLEGILDGWDLYSDAPIPDPTLALLNSICARLRTAMHLASGGMATTCTKFDDLRFQVALSFPGTRRAFVETVATRLKRSLHVNQVFYDLDFQAHLAQPDLDVLLLNVYRDRSSLVVVFLSADYAKSDWCGLEWRAVRDMIKSKSGKQVMYVRFDREPVDGTLSIDGYIDATKYGPDETANFILQRVRDGAKSA